MRTPLAILAILAIAGCGGSGGSGGPSHDPASWTYFGGAYNAEGVRLGPAVVYLGTDDVATVDWLEGTARTTDSGTWRRWVFDGQSFDGDMTYTRLPEYDALDVVLANGITLKCAADRNGPPYNLPPL